MERGGERKREMGDFGDWRIEEVLGDEEIAAEPVKTFVAKVEPKVISNLIKELGVKSPLVGMHHIKRVRRRPNIEGKIELEIILCLVPEFSEQEEISEKVLPHELKELIDRHSLVPYIVFVPKNPARNREEWQQQCLLWPTSFHPNEKGQLSDADVSEEELPLMKKFMTMAMEEAREGEKNWQSNNCALIVDPTLNQIITRGFDETRGWGHPLNCDNSMSVNLSSTVNSTVNCPTISSMLSSTSNPMVNSMSGTTISSTVRPTVSPTDSSMIRSTVFSSKIGSTVSSVVSSTVNSTVVNSRKLSQTLHTSLHNNPEIVDFSKNNNVKEEVESHLSTPLVVEERRHLANLSSSVSCQHPVEEEIKTGEREDRFESDMCHHMEGGKWHPLRHAVIVAIENSAKRDLRLWPIGRERSRPSMVAPLSVGQKREGKESLQKEEKEREEGREGEGEGESYERAEMKRARLEERGENGNNKTNFVTTEGENAHHETESVSTEAAVHMNFDSIPRPYLCTGFDVYVAREPCIMCAMALIHQRVRRVIYAIENPKTGALGSAFKVHKLKGLNHHYKVYKATPL